ncbi:c-type cytochrome [Burkholderia diffusa]|uniref:c-type cytochrome n=1 Tax=Burkholderia diffusa TaxID=488732 RepID=UPI003CC835EB
MASAPVTRMQGDLPAVAWLAVGTASAQVPAPAALVDPHQCMFCHTADMSFLAPSLHQIAERYRDTPRVEDLLANKLRLGGRAHCGDTAMPVPAERGGSLSSWHAHTLTR